MPRPTNKKMLLDLMQKEHQKLVNQIEQLSEEIILHHSQITGYAIKDVLAHLTAWEQLCLGWYQAGIKHKPPQLPHPGYTWRQIPELNKMFCERDSHKTLAEVLNDFHVSFDEILKTIQNIDEEEMFTPEIYSWTNKNAMGTYFVSATSSHYVWAQKEVKKCQKDCQTGG
ncbi:MAG: ClbS/DfsB family four-helix bundle protein [Anaerolineaceae bacterium]|nr:ClbS/DfsB family four-helix bundle protein [Anaerolineaceae bacterium]